MYAYIKGTLEGISENGIIVESGGIGYMISVSAKTMAALPANGSAVTIYTELVISENTGAMLYGFLSLEEKDTFLLLTSVSGVGPKAAMSILSVLTPRELGFAVISEDKKEITRANGVGPKVAGRIILELKDKVDIASYDSDEGITPSAAPSGAATDDVLLALTSLGYSASESLRSINEVEGAADMDESLLLKEALKKLSL